MYYRFFSFHPELSAREVGFFTNVDGHDRLALVAELDDRIVAVGRYDRLHSTTDAEVALVVTDALQGCGIGTLLIEHLASIGADNGLARFVATVLPGNGRMLAVFRASGFHESSRLGADAVDVVLPLTPTAATFAAVEQREHRSEARSIERLLHPRSVAVIGASDRPGSVGHALMRNLLAGGYERRIYLVNQLGRAAPASHRIVRCATSWARSTWRWWPCPHRQSSRSSRAAPPRGCRPRDAPASPVGSAGPSPSSPSRAAARPLGSGPRRRTLLLWPAPSSSLRPRPSWPTSRSVSPSHPTDPPDTLRRLR